MNKTNRWIIALDGSYIDVPDKKLTGFSDNTEEVIVIAPFDTDSAVSFGVGNENRTAKTQYMSLDIDGVVSDWVDDDETFGDVDYQDIADWNVWRIQLNSTAKAYVSKYRGSYVYFSFRFGAISTNASCVTYKDTFGVDNILPTEDQTTGDYYKLEDLYYTLTTDTNNKTLVLGKGMYVYWGSGGYWVKVGENLVQNTSSEQQAVDPSFAINSEVDDDEINYLVSFESTVADHESRLQTLEAEGSTTAVGISYDGEGTNYLEDKEHVQEAITELDTQIKSTNDSVEENATAINENTEYIDSKNEDLQFKIIELTKENKALSKQVASLNPSNEGVISATVSEFTEHFNAKAAKLPLKIADIKGLKIEQIADGDFDSIGDWIYAGGSETITSNVVSLLGDGTYNYLRVQQTGLITQTAGDKFFVIAKAKIDNALGDILLRLYDGTNTIIVDSESSPTADEWYYLYGIGTTLASGSMSFNVASFYATTTEATGKTLSIDGNFGVMVIPITNTPYSTETADEWDSRITEYLTQGEHWIINPSFEMVGKNLFDKNDIYASDKQWTGSGSIITTSGYNAVLLNVKPSSTYVKTSFENTNVFFDNEMNFISTSYSNAPTTPSNCRYIGVNIQTVNLDTAQLEEGTTATDYEAFNSNTVSVLRKDGEDLNMRSVGTAQDGIVYKNGVPYKNENVETDNVTGIVSVDTTNYPLAKDGGTFINYLTAGGSEIGVIGTDSTSGDGVLDYELATADTSKELEIVGDKPISQPYFTFRQIQTLSDAGIYDNGISIQLTANPISELTYLATIDYESGLETELDVSTAVISGDGLSFTHPDLSDGDFVSFTYDRTNHNIATDIDLEYYNADEVIEDSVTGTVYKTSISAADGVPSIELTEV
jgi:hypothetical protein